MTSKKSHILLTNDDGIDSPGLLAVANALADLGTLTIAAPRDQCSAAGRAIYLWADGKITRRTLEIKGQPYEAFAVGGSPAQTVQHALLEIVSDRRPDLVVSGINYGENMGTSITVSGTVGAAMEAASMGIPAIAVSLQLREDLWLSHDKNIDFSTAAYFTRYFAHWMLNHTLPTDVDLLKIDVPSEATPETPWQLTRLGRHRYWEPVVQRQNGWEGEARVDGKVTVTQDMVDPDTDIHRLLNGVVSITPISIDMSSRVSLTDFEKQIRA